MTSVLKSNDCAIPPDSTNLNFNMSSHLETATATIKPMFICVQGTILTVEAAIEATIRSAVG